jgi:hypothetical protein
MSGTSRTIRSIRVTTRPADDRRHDGSTWLGLVFGLALAGVCVAADSPEEWRSLFDGRSLEHWRSSSPLSFSVRDGAIAATGPLSHLYYVGPEPIAESLNFELKVDVFTLLNSNGGIYVLAELPDFAAPARHPPIDLPRRGIEIQINNTYARDPVRTGSLNGLVDVFTSPAVDYRWFEVHVIINGDSIKVLIDGVPVSSWTSGLTRVPSAADAALRRLFPGTIALQAHDPAGLVYYRGIRVRFHK